MALTPSASPGEQLQIALASELKVCADIWRQLSRRNTQDSLLACCLLWVMT